MTDRSIEVKLKKWEMRVEKCVGGKTDRLRIFKKYVHILLPILYSITDSYSDANYCFEISAGEGIFDVGQKFHPNVFFNTSADQLDEFKYIPPVYWLGQRIMLVFLFIGNIAILFK